MSFNLRQKTAAWPTTTTSLNGVTAASVVTTASLSLPQRDNTVSGVSALVTLGLTTSGLTIVPRAQVSSDGVTWYNGYRPAASISTYTGTGSLVTTSFVMDFTPAECCWRFLRIALTTGGATGGAGDSYSSSYTFLTPGFG